jgi:hypothetical protein
MIYMRRVIGMIIIVCGIGLGLYVGLWVCFVGGVIDVIEQVRAVELSASVTAWGIAKIIFAGLIGFILGGSVSLLGWVIRNRFVGGKK